MHAFSIYITMILKLQMHCILIKCALVVEWGKNLIVHIFIKNKVKGVSVQRKALEFASFEHFFDKFTLFPLYFML